MSEARLARKVKVINKYLTSNNKHFITLVSWQNSDRDTRTVKLVCRTVVLALMEVVL